MKRILTDRNVRNARLLKTLVVTLAVVGSPWR